MGGTGGEQVGVQPWADLDPRLLHDLIRLRVDVFVVEQRCAYPELDGRDVEPGTLHWWTADGDGRPTSYLRTLEDDDGSVRIGRVCTRPDARGDGLAGVLMKAVLDRSQGTRTIVLEAQAHLQTWYARHGFEPTGPEYLDDGIPHIPMHKPAVIM